MAGVNLAGMEIAGKNFGAVQTLSLIHILFEGEAGADIGKNGMDNGYILSIWGMGKVLQKFFFKTIVSY